MSTDNVHARKAEKEKINVHDPMELRSWSNRLGVTKEDLLKAVQQVGDSADKVMDYINKK
jgi:hypothetical protein